MTLQLRDISVEFIFFEQVIALDAMNHEILKDPIEYQNTLTAALLGTASNIVNTTGKQFAQPIQPRGAMGFPKKGLELKQIRIGVLRTFSSFREMLEKYCDAPRNDLPHSAIRMDYSVALDQLPQGVEVVYADPPYTRDHYSRFYHVLETLCLRDNPEISKVKIKGEVKLSRTLYREDRHQSPFCIRMTAPVAFENLFEKVSDLGASLVLSYSPFASNVDEHPRVMTIEKLVSLAKKYFSSVEKRCPGVFKHNKLNSRANSFDEKPNGELLIVCRS